MKRWSVSVRVNEPACELGLNIHFSGVSGEAVFVSRHCAITVLTLIRKCLANLPRLLKWFGIPSRPLGHIECSVESWIVCTVAERAAILRSTQSRSALCEWTGWPSALMYCERARVRDGGDGGCTWFRTCVLVAVQLKKKKENSFFCSHLRMVHVFAQRGLTVASVARHWSLSFCLSHTDEHNLSF